jgi:hypothetical protein
MGAQLWYHEAPWHPQPLTALKTFQARFLAGKYDLSALLPRRLAGAREAVAATQAEGDPYELLETYEEEVRLLERLCSRPIPQDFERQLKILRQISAYSGQGIGNILDVKRISKRRQFDVAQRLSGPELIRLVGTEQPTRAQAKKAIDKINQELGRGECVCFPIYDSREKNQPVGWYFIGNTID